MRLPVALLSVVAVPATVLAAPVVTAPAAVPTARPVAPQVQEIDLPAQDAESGRGGTAGGHTLVETPQRSTEAFSTLGVTWAADPSTGEVSVQVRTRSQGTWTPWVAIETEEADVLAGAPEADDQGVRAGTEPLYAGLSDGVQVRVDVLSGAAPRDLRLALVDPGTSAADAAVAPDVPASTAHAAAARPAIRSRAQWGADESLRSGSPSYASTINAVTVHHTASSNDYSAAEVPALIRGFYAYHVKSQRWSDIGYNVLVDKFGTAWEGRAGGLDKAVVGAHAGGFNTSTAGVSMIGTYGTVNPSAALKETVAQVAAWKLGMYGRDARSSVTLRSAGSTRYAAGTDVVLPRVFAHRDVSTTACPGDRGIATLPWVRDRAAALQAAAPAPAPAPKPPAPVTKPFGSLDSVTGGFDSVRVSGWAIDADAPAHTTVEVRVDGALAGTAVADRSRPDVAAVYPQFSADHGFSTAVPAAPGTRRVCVTALDQAGSSHVSLGCRDVAVASGTPRGSLDGARATADVVGVRVSGWALDPDAGASATVLVLVDGGQAGSTVAALPRADVAAAFPGHGDRLGYDVIVPAAPGARRVCTVARNVGAGADAQLGCTTVDVPVRLAAASAPGARSVDDACPQGVVPSGRFSDTATSVHGRAVDCAVWWQLTAGLTADRYGPEVALTRGQVATFLARLLTAAGTALPAAPPDAFTDDNGSPHQLAINQMAQLGVVSGRGAGRYEPDGHVSRDQMASYLVRAYERRVGAPLPDGGNWYADDDGSVHETNIGRAARAGLTGGTSPGRYSPLSLSDRGQVASFLTRLLDMLVENGRAPRRG